MNNDNCAAGQAERGEAKALRQWFKQSERPVTEHDCPVWVKYCAAEIFLSRYVLAENGAHPADILWSHAAADIPAPPKELTQEDLDLEAYRSWYKHTSEPTGVLSHLPFLAGAAYARKESSEAARADERARLGKEVETWFRSGYEEEGCLRFAPDSAYANDLRALFTESTNNRETK